MIRDGFFISAVPDCYLARLYLSIWGKHINEDRCSDLSRADWRLVPMRIILTLALAVATFLTTNVYGAAVTTYSSRATFLGAVSGENTWDFNGPEGNPVILLNSLGV